MGVRGRGDGVGTVGETGGIVTTHGEGGRREGDRGEQEVEVDEITFREDRTEERRERSMGDKVKS